MLAPILGPCVTALDTATTARVSGGCSVRRSRVALRPHDSPPPAPLPESPRALPAPISGLGVAVCSPHVPHGVVPGVQPRSSQQELVEPHARAVTRRVTEGGLVIGDLERGTYGRIRASSTTYFLRDDRLALSGRMSLCNSRVKPEGCCEEKGEAPPYGFIHAVLVTSVDRPGGGGVPGGGSRGPRLLQSRARSRG